MAKQKKPVLTKQSTDAYFAKKQAEVAERRKNKLTGDDVAQALDERRSSRHRAAGSRSKAISLGLGVALLVGAGAVVTGTVLSGDSFVSDTKANSARIAELNEQLQGVPAGGDGGKADEYRAQLAAQILTATEQGEQVAALQQEFLTIFAPTEGEQVEGNGAASPALMASIEIRKALAPFFTSESLLVEDKVAYAPGSSVPFADDEIDPRFPWYQPSTIVDGRIVYGAADTCTWDLVSVTATGVGGVLDATWLCQGAEGDLYSWATASWYAEEEAFGRVSVGETTIGNNVGRSVAPEEEPVLPDGTDEGQA